MFSIGCYEDKVVAYSIPLGQKHFWVESRKNIILENICFLQSGELNIEVERNRTRIFELCYTISFTRLERTMLY